MLDPLASVLIEGRRWFDKVNGNTYHSARIWINGRVVGQLGLTYGYENQYITTSLDWLIKNEFLPAECAGWPLYRITREFGITVYAVVADGLKRDLFKPTVKEYINA
jgi:hypothetical protein